MSKEFDLNALREWWEQNKDKYAEIKTQYYYPPNRIVMDLFRKAIVDFLELMKGK